MRHATAAPLQAMLRMKLVRFKTWPSTSEEKPMSFIETKRHGRANVLIFSIFFLAALSAWGQDMTNALNIGLPENGVFTGSDFDTVQLNNGNLHIELPLWTLKGRGLSGEFKFVYDNKGWHFKQHCDSKTGLCTDTVHEDMYNDMQWRLAGPADYILGEKYVPQSCPGGTFFAYS